MTLVAAYLTEVFDKKKGLRPQYSLRAFARDCGMSPSQMSEVLAGKAGISIQAASLLAERLGLAALQKKKLFDLVDSEFSRNQQTKKKATQRVLEKKFDVTALPLDDFRYMCDWQSVALLEALKIPNVDVDPTELARSLNITPAEVSAAIERLVRLKVLSFVEQGKPKLSESHATSTDIPSAAIRKFHAEVIKKSLLSLETVPPDKRDFHTFVFSSREERLPEIKQSLLSFIERFSEEFSSSDEDDMIFGLGIQLSPLSSQRLKKKQS